MYFFLGFISLFRHFGGVELMPFDEVWFGGDERDDELFELTLADERVGVVFCAAATTTAAAATAVAEDSAERAAFDPHAWWWLSQSLCWQNEPQYRARLHPEQVSVAFLPQFQHACVK